MCDRSISRGGARESHDAEMVKLELEGPGLAFWHPDRWAYGLVSIDVPAVRDWTLGGLRLPRFNMAKPSEGTAWWMLHFNWFDFLRLYIGPLEIRLLYIEDRR